MAGTAEQQANQATRTTGARSPKTLWDWLQLLLVPVILLAGILWLGIQQQQDNQQFVQQQRATTTSIAAQQQQDALLANYQDQIADMMLHDNLLKAQTISLVSQVAQVRTLSVFRQANPASKALLMRFLYDTNLINNDFHIISMRGVDVTNAHLQNLDLRDTYLSGVNLRGSDMRSINLSFATLLFADLSGTNLHGADLHATDMHNVDLAGADLSDANLKDSVGLTNDQLAKAKSLAGAIMPDGSTHP
jgi:uncharacterized protein YjbI with pentapeptide repeats